MAVSRSIRQNIQQYSWLVFALGSLLIALLAWAMIDKSQLIKDVQSSSTETQVEIQPEKVATTVHLGALTEEVKPLELSSRVVVSSDHAPEFRGTKFVKENQRQWTTEIFRSSDEAIIKNFLLNRPDRKKFTYIRLTGQDQVEQYVLTYGSATHAEEATRQFAQLNLILPESIHPKAQQFKDYMDLVNDLGSDEMKSSTNQLYAIQLKPAALPKVDETLFLDGRSGTQRTFNPANTSNQTSTVKTTVTRRDAQGKVLDVKQTQSNPVTTSPSKPEKPQENVEPPKREISDPFN